MQKEKNECRENLWYTLLPLLLTTAAVGSKSVGAWDTLITALTHHIGFTLTLSAQFVANAAGRALGITLTGYGEKKEYSQELGNAAT